MTSSFSWRNDPKPPTTAAVRRWLESEFGIKPPSVAEKIAGAGAIEVGDFNESRSGWPVWLHETGAPTPAEFFFHLSEKP